MKKWSKFSALPNYLGGKRKLVPEIFKHVPAANKAPVFADLFLGGGSVSLFAKAKGHKVKSNDISLRSSITGDAFITNSDYKITDEDIMLMFVPIKNKGFIVKNYGLKLFTTKIAEFLDNAFAQIDAMPQYKQALLKTMLVKFMIACRPFSRFSTMKSTQQLENREFEEAFKNATYKNTHMRQIKDPIGSLRSIAKKVNAGVFNNGEKNEMTKSDVFKFVKGLKADIAYFDPPYAETSSYEETYVALDNILAGEMRKPDISEFSKHDALEFIDKLLAACKHIPDWIISMGQTDPEKGIKPEELLSLAQKYKPHAQVRLLDHVWTSKTGKVDKSKECTEYIIYTHTN